MPESRQASKASPETARSQELILDRAETIDKFNAREWDSMAAHRGCMPSAALTLFERVFGSSPDPTQHWTFRYYVIRDADGAPVLATFFTKSLWKADMLAPADVSARIEQERERAQDPFHLTQQVFSQGCLLSEGDHLWLRDPVDSATSREALALLMKAVRADAQQLGCEVRVLRDIPAREAGLVDFFEKDGFIRMPAPESLVLHDTMDSEEELVASLSASHRYHDRRRVKPFNDRYRTEIFGLGANPLDPVLANHLGELYRNVKGRSLGLNTFDLPGGIFEEMSRSEGWEICVLRDVENPDALPVGFFAAFHGQPDYVPLVAGLDYGLVDQAGLYRQVLRHVIARAREQGHRRVLFGMGAVLEKRRMGAEIEPALIMMEADDAYAFDAVAHIEADAN
jgi:hypothetical protein